MFKKFLCSVCFVLMLGLAMPATTNADLVGWWRFEEGSGDTTGDSSGNGHDGTLLGTPQWAPGPEGQGTGAALIFGADKCTAVNCGIFDPTDGAGQFTVALWAFWDGTGTFQHFFTKSNTWGATTMMLQVELWGAHTNSAYTDRVGVSYQPAGSVAFSIMPKNEWVHLAWTFDGSNLKLHVNGVDETGPKAFSIGPNVDAPVLIGASDLNGGRIFNGLLDEVRVYSHALSQVEIIGAMKGQAWPYAFGPDPADGVMHPATWAQLSWSRGDFAVSHDVYIGDNFDDVDAGTAETFRGNQTATSLLIGFPGYPYPEGLVPGTTYYWRIDEVNDADPNSPWKGDVWSFSIPPKTAYFPNPADGEGSVALNASLRWTAGFGAKLHTIYFGDDFDDVNSATAGTLTGTTMYNPGPLESEKVYYWRVDEADPPNTYKGQVWSFATLGAVGDPYPSNGASSAEMNAILTWMPSDNAASHQLYFGTDKEAVRKAGATSPEYKGVRALGAESYDPGLLAPDSTFYWRIDEVNNTNAASPWNGPLWSFTTADFLLLDGFESYNDIDPPDPESHRIFETWLDGFGTTTNGALVGNDLPPYAEQTIIHGGAQSMPYKYDNNLKFSEATMTLSGAERDWTAQGVTSLSLWFRGASANAPERMYVALNGTAVVYHENPAAAQRTSWTEWAIPLQQFADLGVNLSNVTSITIGFGTRANTTTAGGAGQMYFDDIRLYRPRTP